MHQFYGHEEKCVPSAGKTHVRKIPGFGGGVFCVGGGVVPILFLWARGLRDSIAERGIAPICLVFIGYRASIAEIPPLRGGCRTSTSHALQGGNAQKRGRGCRTQLAMLRHQKPHSAQWGGIAEIVSRYRAIRGH